MIRVQSQSRTVMEFDLKLLQVLIYWTRDRLQHKQFVIRSRLISFGSTQMMVTYKARVMLSSGSVGCFCKIFFPIYCRPDWPTKVENILSILRTRKWRSSMRIKVVRMDMGASIRQNQKWLTVHSMATDEPIRGGMHKAEQRGWSFRIISLPLNNFENLQIAIYYDDLKWRTPTRI